MLPPLNVDTIAAIISATTVENTSTHPPLNFIHMIRHTNTAPTIVIYPYHSITPVCTPEAPDHCKKPPLPTVEHTSTMSPPNSVEASKKRRIKLMSRIQPLHHYTMFTLPILQTPLPPKYLHCPSMLVKAADAIFLQKRRVHVTLIPLHRPTSIKFTTSVGWQSPRPSLTTHQSYNHPSPLIQNSAHSSPMSVTLNTLSCPPLSFPE